MEVVHNALKEPEKKVRAAKPKRASWAMKFAYRHYKEVLEERAGDIAKIQEFFPGWLPPFEY